MVDRHAIVEHPGGRVARRTVPVAWLAFGIFVVILALIVVGWLLVTLKVDAIVMAIPALVPLGIVLAAVWWLDRWEREPRVLIALALLYGSGASIVGTLLSSNFMIDVASQVLQTPGEFNEFSILVQGPVLEETMKGLGLVLILLIAPRQFDGPLDGFIYAAMIGAGFAFTENIIYFANQGSTGLAFVWLLVVRCILSPFAHVLFTGMTGMALGWGARRGGFARPALWGLLGLGLAIIAHAFWNGGSVLVLPLLGIAPTHPLGWVVFYLVVQVPIFVLVAWFLVRLQERDRRTLRRRLREYQNAGWFTPAEVSMICHWDARERALSWAKEKGPDARKAMQAFIDDSTRLAFAREHASVNKRDADRRVVERALLDRVRAHRRELSDAIAA